MRTVTYDDLKSRYQSALGIDLLLTDEETAFKNSLNSAVRSVWSRHRWPPLTAVVSKTLAAVDNSTIKAEKATRIDNASDLYDVYAVFNKNPFEDNTAGRIEFTLISDYIVVNKSTSDSTIYVVGSQVPPSDYGVGTTTLPRFMERMLLSYCISDAYKADGQLDKSIAEEARAEEYLTQELDRFERLQDQVRPTLRVNTYPAYWPTLLVSQTVT